MVDYIIGIDWYGDTDADWVTVIMRGAGNLAKKDVMNAAERFAEKRQGKACDCCEYEAHIVSFVSVPAGTEITNHGDFSPWYFDYVSGEVK